MPRVLHVLKYYRPAFTGEGVFLERSSAVMQEMAPDVEHELLVTHTPAPADRGDAATCSTLSRVTYLSGAGLSALALHLRLAAWFAAHLGRYDAVHFRTHADWYFAGPMLAKAMGRRLVLSATLDDSIPVLVSRYRPALRALATRGFRLFDAFLSISPKLDAETRGFGMPPERCHLIPCGITVPPTPTGQRAAMRSRIGAAPGDPVLLFVGGLCARKDPLTLIEGLPAIRRAAPGARLVLVGPELEPAYVVALRDRVAALGLDGAVTFAGEQLDPHPWFAAADILAFASRMEGFGTVVPEAMAHGLPVVARRLPGVNEDFVIPDETGFLFETRTGFEVAAARLAADPALRQRLGAAGRRLAREKFSMRAVAARTLALYGLAGHILPGSAAEPESALPITASIPDARFHRPAATPGDDTPLLLTTVDAEEEFDWARPFSRDHDAVSSMSRQHLAHRVFERHGVVPLYLADYPVAAQEEGAAPLRELLADGVAELGAQLHPWVTPPFDEVLSERNSYAGNLPPLLELEKARRLTLALEDAFGTQPRVFRTGRYGFGPRTADILLHLGYEADSSVMPCWPRRGGGWSYSARPFWLDRERRLLEIPVSAAFVGRLSPLAPRLAPALFHPAVAAAGVTGAAAKLGLMERIRLSPEGMTLEEAKRLTRAMRAAGHRVFVLTYHSPSLAPGHTPYVRDQDGVRRFLDWLDGYYAFFREELGGRPASWREVRHGAAAAATAAVAAR
ncbi:MAG: glycosyltransferase [Acetobacteraceae bacterium]|nr:glycosyltransferase [Acetobacteraceae bacterium]